MFKLFFFQRQGNLCRRCQRSTDINAFDDYSVCDDDDDTGDISAIGSYVETYKHEVLQKLQVCFFSL